jgi:ParB family transcriptional regulator, chromosome partitioning protein
VKKMAKKTGLGKGLNALFSEPVDESEEIKDGEVVKELKIIEVEPNRDQPRKRFDEEALDELAESIKRYGLIQPIVVAKKDNYYQIIAGERRWRASKKAGLTTIPAIIREDDEKKNKEIALIENIQREDLNAVEKAIGIKLLMEQNGLSQMEVADLLGKSRSAIANTLRILNLDERVLELAKLGKLTEGHCRALLCFEDGDKQYLEALKLIETGRSVRDIERKTQRNKPKKMDKQYAAICNDVEDRFQSFFGTKVKVDAGKRSGKIIIQYNTNDDLARILDLIQ